MARGERLFAGGLYGRADQWRPQQVATASEREMESLFLRPRSRGSATLDAILHLERP